MNSIRLVDRDGKLYFPSGGSLPYPASLAPSPDAPSILVRVYGAGDCDTIPWPLVSDYRSTASLRYRLAIALYDERETNEFFPADAQIELPDGTPFDFDWILVEPEEPNGR